MRRWSWLVVALLVSACAEPPNKEMDQAQGAIDAARAAGAERYAASEYTAATDALKNSNDAAATGDYRLALNYALESHEQAQRAARATADTKAQVRAEVERAMAEIAALMAQASTRLAAARSARVAARLLTQPAGDIAAVNVDVQKAGEAIQADDYLEARRSLEGVKERIEKALAAVDAATGAPASRRRR